MHHIYEREREEMETEYEYDRYERELESETNHGDKNNRKGSMGCLWFFLAIVGLVIIACVIGDKENSIGG